MDLGTLVVLFMQTFHPLHVLFLFEGTEIFLMTPFLMYLEDDPCIAFIFHSFDQILCATTNQQIVYSRHSVIGPSKHSDTGLLLVC